MRIRSRYLIITVLMLCSSLLRGQSAPQGNQLNTPRQGGRKAFSFGLRGGAGSAGSGEVVLQARLLEAQNGIYTAQGDVQIDYGGLRLTADRITLNRATSIAIATGHVAFDLPAEQTHIEGTRGIYDFRNSTGEFDNFQGVSGIQLRAGQAGLVSNNPLIFSGKKLLRLGERKYRLEDGTITSCTVPHPNWTLSAQRVDVELGKNASLRHATFHLLGVPVFYAPYLTHSTNGRGRHSGFLLPLVGQNSQKGTILGDSYFWAPKRNIDLTVGGQILTSRGFGESLTLASFPTLHSEVDAGLDGIFDRQGQGGQEAHIYARHSPEHGFRTILDANFLTSYLYRLEFQNTFAAAVNSEVISTGFTERQENGYDLALVVHRYQNFLGVRTQALPLNSSINSNQISLAALPQVNFDSYDRPLRWLDLRQLPVYFSWTASGGLMDRSEPGFSSGLMERAFIQPELTVPFETWLGNFTETVSANGSYYSRELTPASALTRQATPQLNPGQALGWVAGSNELVWDLPALEKVYHSTGGLLGDRLKHVIEPRIAYRYTGGVNDVNQVIRFDAEDILSNTDELDYSLTNRFLTRDGPNGATRDFASWTVEQKYFLNPTFSGALVPGATNIFWTAAMLSPFTVLAEARHLSPITSIVRIAPYTHFDGDWRLDIDPAGQIDGSAFTGDFHIGKEFVSGSHFLVRTPPGLLPQGLLQTSFDQFQFASGYGDPTHPGWSGALAAAYDARSGQVQYSGVQATYNSNCCGLSVEYRRIALIGLRNENQFRATFNLANVGSFGNLKRQERIF